MINSAKFSVFFILILKIFLVSTQDDADNFTQLIAGGYRPREHTLAKHIVSIHLLKRTSKHFGSGHYCGGSILTSRTILTAAHCVWDKRNKKIIDKSKFQVVAKTPNRLKKSQHTEIIDVQRIIMHPNFPDSNPVQNDIALMELTSDIGEDGVYAQSISLPDGPAKTGMKCTVIGWGRLFFGGPAAADALYIDLNILSSSRCEKIFKYYDEGMVCAGDLSDPEKDMCQGDSGGPLICEGKVTGVVSFGKGCVRGLDVYMDVWYYRDWILGDGKKVHRINILKVLLLPLLVWIVS